jgi:hypothetical protein
MQAYLWLVADLRAAWRFTPAAWRRAWAILIPASLTWMVALSPVRAGPWTALAVAVTLMASAELYRIATPQAVSARGAAVGRLAIVWLLTLAFFAVLGSLLFVVFLSSAYAVASAGAGFDAIDDRGREVLGAVAAVGVSLLSWAMTRIALAPAATAAAGRVLVLNAWPLTRGIGWALLAVRVAIAVPAVGVAALALRAPHVGGAATSSGAWMLGSVAGLVIGGVWLPLNTGLMAYIYHRRANP